MYSSNLLLQRRIDQSMARKAVLLFEARRYDHGLEGLAAAAFIDSNGFLLAVRSFCEGEEGGGGTGHIFDIDV